MSRSPDKSKKSSALSKKRPTKRLVKKLFLLGFAAILLAIATRLVYRQPSATRPNVPVNGSRTPLTTANVANLGLGQFPPRTNAERELEEMLHGSDNEINLELANWLVIADIPEFADYPRQEFGATLDSMEKLVLHEMQRMKSVALARGKNVNDPDVQCSIFCNAVLKLKFAYSEQYAQTPLSAESMRGLYSNPDNIFLAGLVRTRQGSCVSMPMIYLILGERLKLPIYLVGVGQHLFIRWQQPGYRMNIETTIVQSVKVTPDDSVYIEAEEIKPEEIRGNVLRNMTRREVLGEMFYARAAYWRAHRDPTRECYDLSRASHLSPDDYRIERAQKVTFERFGIQPWHKSLQLTLTP